MMEKFAAGDRVSWREVFAEDVIWDTTAATHPEAAVSKGHAEVERFFIKWLGAFRDMELENLEFIDAGDSVVAAFRWRGKGKTSGIETQTTMYGVYDVREGLITHYRQFETREEALAAAG